MSQNPVEYRVKNISAPSKTETAISLVGIPLPRGRINSITISETLFGGNNKGVLCSLYIFDKRSTTMAKAVQEFITSNQIYTENPNFTIDTNNYSFSASVSNMTDTDVRIDFTITIEVF